MNVKELAEKIVAKAPSHSHDEWCHDHTTFDNCSPSNNCKCQDYWLTEIEALLTEFRKEIQEEVHKELALEQALIHGESVMVDGKVFTNEELYKQPTDYIKEAVAQEREECAKVAEANCLKCNKDALASICVVAAQIRRRGEKG